jgi:TetR/AcrR family transcriptional regulator, transcriptional repressor for nem operon
MRKSKEATAQTRESVVQAAADLIRERGLSEASLANVMARAGLTHGGFYRHFRNRDQLLAEALALSGRGSLDLVYDSLRAGGRSQAVVGYLSKAHRDAATPTCPLAAVGSETARANPEARAAATKTVRELIDALGGEPADAALTSRSAAVAGVATMVGALTLSRIVTDPALSDEILAAARRHLLAG